MLDPDVAAIAAELMASGDHGDVIERAETIANERRRFAAQSALVRWAAEHIDPFLPPANDSEHMNGADAPATAKQRATLARAGIEPPAQLTKGMASDWIRRLKARQAAGLASYKQTKFLQRQGYSTDGLSVAEASELIRACLGRFKKAS